MQTISYVYFRGLVRVKLSYLAARNFDRLQNLFFNTRTAPWIVLDITTASIGSEQNNEANMSNYGPQGYHYRKGLNPLQVFLQRPVASLVGLGLVTDGLLRLARHKECFVTLCACGIACCAIDSVTRMVVSSNEPAASPSRPPHQTETLFENVDGSDSSTKTVWIQKSWHRDRILDWFTKDETLDLVLILSSALTIPLTALTSILIADTFCLLFSKAPRT